MSEDIVGGVTTTTTDNSQASMLDTLVGDSRKYKDTEALAKSRIEADQFIETLKTENENMRTKLETLESKASESATLKSVLDAINNRSTTGEEANNQGASTPEDIKAMVGSILDSTRATEQAGINRTLVNSALVRAFNGDATKAKEYYNRKVNESKLNGESFKTLSETSPTAALTLLGINQSSSSKTTGSPSTFSDLNTASNTNPNVRNQEYYRQLRKEKGSMKFYADTKLVQQEIQDSAVPGFYTK